MSTQLTTEGTMLKQGLGGPINRMNSCVICSLPLSCVCHLHRQKEPISQAMSFGKSSLKLAEDAEAELGRLWQSGYGELSWNW